MCDSNTKIAELLQTIVSRMRDDLNRVEICVEALDEFSKRVPLYGSDALRTSPLEPREKPSREGARGEILEGKLS
jgi:hypothetical protein